MKVRWILYGKDGSKSHEFETNEQSEPPVDQWIRDADGTWLYRVSQVTRIMCPNKRQTIGVEVAAYAAMEVAETAIHDAFDHQTKKLGTW